MSTMRRRMYPSARARMGASVIACMLPGSCSMLLPDARRHFDHFHARQRALLFVRLARDHGPALLQRNVPGEKRHHDDR